MGIVIIIIIAVVVIAIIASSKKGGESSTCGASSSSFRQQELKSKMQEQLQELVRIGVETLTSLGMTKHEKEDLIGNLIDSIRENSSDQEEEKGLVFQIMRKSYSALLDKFSFDKEFCAELTKCSENFEDGVKNGTLETYGWDILIEMIEDEKEKVRNMDTDSNHSENTFSISFAVKGLQYRDEDAQDAAHDLEEGADLELEEEPDNEYDPGAIKVLTTDGYHIGYVEATKAKRISSNMDKLVECKVKQISEYEDLFIYGLVTFKE